MSEPASGGSPETQLRQIFKEFESGVISGSAAESLEPYLAPDYVFTSPSGRVSNRSEILDGLRSGNVQFHEYAITDLEFRIYGSFAVVVGEASGKGTNPGGEQLQGAHRFTSTWSNDGTQWRLVAWQATEIATSGESKSDS